MADAHEMDATLHAAQWWHDRLSLMGKSAVVEVHPAEAQGLDKTISGLLAIIAGQSREITQLQRDLALEQAVLGDSRKETERERSLLNMYASAWAREIGREGFVSKVHEIDSLVLTTRQIMDERKAALPSGFTIEFRPKQRDSTEPSVWRVTATGFIATEYSYANAVRRAWTQALLDSKENKE